MSVHLFLIIRRLNYIDYRRIIILPVLACCLYVGCVPPIPQECEDFFSLSPQEGEQVFATYPLDKQLRIYKCGMYRAPPATWLAGPIADKGDGAIPYLFERLESDEDEMFQSDIVYIFRVMAVKGKLHGRQDVINKLRRDVARIKITAIREEAQRDLDVIEKDSGG